MSTKNEIYNILDMELDFTTKTLSILVIIIIIIMIVHLSFTVWSYLQLRNKQGPRGKQGPPGPRSGPAK